MFINTSSSSSNISSDIPLDLLHEIAAPGGMNTPYNIYWLMRLFSKSVSTSILAPSLLQKALTLVNSSKHILLLKANWIFNMKSSPIRFNTDAKFKFT